VSKRVRGVDLPDGGRIAVAVRGKGPPVLLLRPLGGSLVSWGPFADALARRCRVIAFDPRGAGDSSPPPLGTTTRSMAVDALAVLDALAIERAHVYGLSLGGMVASWVAIDAPGRVARLVLASTPVRGSMLPAGGWRRALELARCLVRPARDAEACLAVAILSNGFRARRPDEVARIAERARARPASHRGLLTLLAAAAWHDVAARIGDVAADTLVLAGADDVLVRPEAQRALATRLPRARAAVVAAAGHDVSAEAPACVAEHVLGHVLGA
jgi:3-oxoadipate enol-lactonase